jgi:hypothetical protein
MTHTVYAPLYIPPLLPPLFSISTHTIKRKLKLKKATPISSPLLLCSKPSSRLIPSPIEMALSNNQRMCIILIMWLVFVLSNAWHIEAARPLAGSWPSARSWSSALAQLLSSLSGSGSSNCTNNPNNTGGHC